MFNVKRSNVSTAIDDFHQARRKAIIYDLVTRITGSSSSLLSYDEVRKLLKAHPNVKQTIQSIPLDAIVGSVNRYDDFTRNFLPRANIDPERWASVMMATYQKDDIHQLKFIKLT
jgi:hypothetical protein